MPFPLFTEVGGWSYVIGSGVDIALEETAISFNNGSGSTEAIETYGDFTTEYGSQCDFTLRTEDVVAFVAHDGVFDLFRAKVIFSNQTISVTLRGGTEQVFVYATTSLQNINFQYRKVDDNAVMVVLDGTTEITTFTEPYQFPANPLKYRLTGGDGTNGVSGFADVPQSTELQEILFTAYLDIESCIGDTYSLCVTGRQYNSNHSVL